MLPGLSTGKKQNKKLNFSYKCNFYSKRYKHYPNIKHQTVLSSSEFDRQDSLCFGSTEIIQHRSAETTAGGESCQPACSVSAEWPLGGRMSLCICTQACFFLTPVSPVKHVCQDCWLIFPIDHYSTVFPIS